MIRALSRSPCSAHVWQVGRPGWLTLELRRKAIIIRGMLDELDNAVASLERWLTGAGMRLTDVFGPPATADQVAEVEQALARRLPGDYRRFVMAVGGQRFVPPGEEQGHLTQPVQNIEMLGPSHALGEWRSTRQAWGY